jgi:hypothetical protein
MPREDNDFALATYNVKRSQKLELKEISSRENVPVTELVREALDMVIEKYSVDENEVPE